jgi:hypothetical protein
MRPSLDTSRGDLLSLISINQRTLSFIHPFPQRFPGTAGRVAARGRIALSETWARRRAPRVASKEWAVRPFRCYERPPPEPIMRTSLALVVASLLSVPALSRASDPAAPAPAAAKPGEPAAAPRERDAKPAEGEAAKPTDPAKPAPKDAKATQAPKGAKPAGTKDAKGSDAAPAEKPCEPVKPCAID